MISFKEFLKENIKIEDLDQEFLKRAEKVAAVNLSASDFKSTKHKNEIRYLMGKNFLTEINIFDLTTKGDFSKEKFNAFMEKLTPANKALIFDYGSQWKMGPGEIVSYLIFDDCSLGGEVSGDLHFGSKVYEMKAVKISGEYMSDFKLGGTVNFNKIINDLFELGKKAEISFGPQGNSIEKGPMSIIKEKFPNEFKEIEKRYAETAYKGYFSKHTNVFVGANIKASSNGGFKFKCIDVKDVKENQIFIERYTSNSLKPLIKI